MAGLNFGPEFLNRDITCRDSSAELIAKHARHMADVGGIGCVGLGGDLDGVEGNLEIGDPSKMELLEEALKRQGSTHDEIEKIFYKNAERLIKEAMK